MPVENGATGVECQRFDVAQAHGCYLAFVRNALRYYNHWTIRSAGHLQNTVPDDREVSFQQENFWLDGL